MASDETPQREMTLREWVERLPESHFARREYRALTEPSAPREAPDVAAACRASAALADDLNRGASPANLAEQILDEADIIALAVQAQAQALADAQQEVERLRGIEADSDESWRLLERERTVSAAMRAEMRVAETMISAQGVRVMDARALVARLTQALERIANSRLDWMTARMCRAWPRPTPPGRRSLHANGPDRGSVLESRGAHVSGPRVRP